MFIHHPPMDVWVVSAFMATVISAAVNMCVRVFEHLLSTLGSIPRSANAGSYTNSILTV